jgi:hypothetical protein
VPLEHDPEWCLDRVRIVNEGTGEEAEFFYGARLDAEKPKVGCVCLGGV